MSISHPVPGPGGPATILQFPTERARSGNARGERVLAETCWLIVATRQDGSRRFTKLRSPRFLSPRRAYSVSEGAARGVRSLLLYKFARRRGRSAPGRSHADDDATARAMRKRSAP